MGRQLLAAIEVAGGHLELGALVTVDPVTKAESVKGDVGFERLFGVGYDQGQGRLYGFSASGEVIEIQDDNGITRPLNPPLSYRRNRQ